jgi:polyhydroxyalkanoate synthase
LRYLAGRGVRPLLLEWGEPGDAERDFDFTDYVAGRLERALDAALEIAGAPVSLVGYCMGGLMALALALRRPADIGALTLLATPWDFHAEHAAEARRLALLAGPLDHLVSLSVDFLQALFAALDPLLVPNKFRAFAIVPGRDRIVSPKGAVALGEAIPDAATIAVPLGHIGMIASAKAPEAVWRPLAAWLADGRLPGGDGRDGNP